MDGDLEPPRAIAAGRLLCAGCGTDLPVEMLVQREGGWWCRGCLARFLPLPPPLPPPPAGWRALVAELDLRRIALSAIRNGAYLLVVAAMGWLSIEQGSLLYGFLTGFYSADNVTWLGFRVLALPDRAATFSLETLIAFAVGGAIIAWRGAIIVPQEPSALAVSFTTFLLVMAIKIALHVMRADEDGGEE